MLQKLSEQLLLAVKQEESVDDLVAQLKSMPGRSLDDLANDHQKIAFWVNTYNAWYQILRVNWEIEKSRIYNVRKIAVGPTDRFSLDEIEHGILRRLRFKYAAGYLPNPFARRRIRQLVVDKLDWRIHFALNCGAQSCPPIAFYTVERLDSQLDLATSSYLNSETQVDHASKEIHVTQLFRWFAADFGGKSGILELLSEQLDIDTKGYRLVYKRYDWDEQLGNFS